MTASRDLRTETHYRHAVFDRAAVDNENRTVPASLSSETPVERWFGMEILSHQPGAVDLSRATDGLPLLWNHDSDKPIGLVENVRLDKGVLRGDLRFSRNQRAEEVWQDVKDGMLRNISIGYSITEFVEDKKTESIRATRWALVETSIAPVPADPTVGIHRSASLSPVSTTEVAMTTDTPAIAATPSPVDLTAIRHEHEVIATKARADATVAERRRVAEVAKVFDFPSVPQTAEMQALRARAIDEGWSAGQTSITVLQAIGQATTPAVDHRGAEDSAMGIHHQQPVNQTRASAYISVDALDKFKIGVADALAVRARIETGSEQVRKAREGGFLGMRLSRIAGEYLTLMGVNIAGVGDDQVSERAMKYRASGMTTSDFTNLLSNTATKALLQGWSQAPETWQQWVRIGQVPDFKTAERTGLSGFTSLSVVPEDGEITYGKFTDRKETIQAVSYAKKFRLTYQAVKNDDLSAFTAIPRGMGRAAQSIIGDTVYSLLNGVGPTLTQDSIALWDTSTHKNYVAAATGPNTTTLDTAFQAMSMQKDPNNTKVLNIAPRYLLVPKAIETTARVLVAAEYDVTLSPGSTSGKNTMSPNPFRNRLEVISDARLDGQTYGTLAWYLLADPNVFDTVEVAFVDGIAEPYLRENDEWDTRGVEWVVGVDFGVAALDFRAMHKYRGN